MASPDIRDVPCVSCQNGYGKPHTCDIPDHCPCDKKEEHQVSATPITPGSVIYIGIGDPNDPESPLEAYLVTPQGEPEDLWVSLAWTTPDQSREQFIWLVKSAAAFHNLPVQNETGVEG